MASSLAHVPAHLTIKVLYSDDDIIVIDKPCNLRSVPGHASEQNGNGDKYDEGNRDEKSTNGKPQRMTAQEAWVKAIRSFASQDGKTGDDDVTSQTIVSQDDYQNRAVNELTHNLSITSDTNSIPRKCPVFERYCQRNRRRLLPSFPELDTFSSDDKSSQEPPTKRAKKSYTIPTKLRSIAQIVFSIVQQRQRPLMNLPTPTEDEESAIGQLRMLGFGDYAHNNHGPPETLEDVKKRIADESKGNGEKQFKLHVVHRLDMQVSVLTIF